jgi:hypothetical protein
VAVEKPINISSNAFNCYETAVLYVPEGSINAYQNAPVWKNFAMIEKLFRLGDVNHDGFVNVTDVSLSVNYILGNIPPVFYKENADVDQDNEINITDITNLVNLILTQN